MNILVFWYGGGGGWVIVVRVVHVAERFDSVRNLFVVYVFGLLLDYFPSLYAVGFVCGWGIAGVTCFVVETCYVCCFGLGRFGF